MYIATQSASGEHAAVTGCTHAPVLGAITLSRHARQAASGATFGPVHAVAPHSFAHCPLAPHAQLRRAL